MTDHDLYKEYDDGCDIMRSLFDSVGAIIPVAIDNDAIHLLDLDILKEKITDGFRVFNIVKILKLNKDIYFDYEHGFKVDGNFFQSIDDAVAAVKLSAFA